MSDWHWAEDDRWLDLLDAERDEENEHLRDKELRERERLDEKGLPHAFKCYDPEAAWFRQMEEEAA